VQANIKASQQAQGAALMKKIVIALLVIFGIIVVAIGGIGYYVFNKARAFLAPIQQYAALDKNVSNTSAYTPPSNGELTEDMVKRFMAVQQSMITKLGPTVNEMKATEDAFMAQQQAEHRKSTPGEDFKVITDMMQFVLQAKNAWADALNQQRFSIDEYYWVRGRVYAAAGMQVEELGLRKLSEQLKEGGAAMGDMGGRLTNEVATSEPVPDKNRALIAPYVPKMHEWAVFAFFGL
jgi:hypothetical protein